MDAMPSKSKWRARRRGARSAAREAPGRMVHRLWAWGREDSIRRFLGFCGAPGGGAPWRRPAAGSILFPSVGRRRYRRNRAIGDGRRLGFPRATSLGTPYAEGPGAQVGAGRPVGSAPGATSRGSDDIRLLAARPATGRRGALLREAYSSGYARPNDDTLPQRSYAGPVFGWVP